MSLRGAGETWSPFMSMLRLEGNSFRFKLQAFPVGVGFFFFFLLVVVVVVVYVFSCVTINVFRPFFSLSGLRYMSYTITNRKMKETGKLLRQPMLFECMGILRSEPGA